MIARNVGRVQKRHRMSAQALIEQLCYRVPKRDEYPNLVSARDGDKTARY